MRNKYRLNKKEELEQFCADGTWIPAETYLVNGILHVRDNDKDIPLRNMIWSTKAIALWKAGLAKNARKRELEEKKRKKS